MIQSEVVSVSKYPRDKSLEKIQFFGINTLEGYVKLSMPQLLERMERDPPEQFYVRVNGSKVFLKMDKSNLGFKYVRTRPRGTERDHLLNLPDCPLINIKPVSTNYSFMPINSRDFR